MESVKINFRFTSSFNQDSQNIRQIDSINVKDNQRINFPFQLQVNSIVLQIKFTFLDEILPNLIYNLKLNFIKISFFSKIFKLFVICSFKMSGKSTKTPTDHGEVSQKKFTSNIAILNFQCRLNIARANMCINNYSADQPLPIFRLTSLNRETPPSSFFDLNESLGQF